MQQITLAEASENLSELIEAAINGEEIVITIIRTASCETNFCIASETSPRQSW
ncbi:type II toxin-antitoxin system Phd/YefM family antitoxin [Tolypothrix sp. VBCCA 56010]|uniref:type II toxin-antitoxin system Phd/YefM family antitoxin n=1 Tax=Tolypothrix sp. VBCCA 56010 TaxID=3137731 RepID=UPI003D7CB260